MIKESNIIINDMLSLEGVGGKDVLTSETLETLDHKTKRTMHKLCPLVSKVVYLRDMG